MADGEGMKHWNLLSLGYTESQGNPVLRNEISKLYEGITAKDITVMAPEEGIFIAMNVLLEKGDEVIVTFPGYQSLYEVAHSIGCEVKRWAPRKEKDWHFSTEDLEELISSDTKMMVINFPHNPTGSIISKEEHEQIIKLAEENNILIFSDEMYRFLEYDENERLASMIESTDNAIALGGLSKSFGLAGLRIGWLVTKNKDWHEKFIMFKDYTTICNSAPSEILAFIGLRAKDKIISKNRQLIAQNLQTLNQFFKNHRGFFKWKEPQAGSIAFPALNINMPASDFCNKLIQQKGVMVLPGDVYDYGGEHLRIGFGRKSFPVALEQLREFIKNMD